MKINDKSKKMLLASGVAVIAVAGIGTPAMAAELGQGTNVVSTDKATSDVTNPTTNVAPTKDGEIVRPEVKDESKFTDEEKAKIDAEIKETNDTRQALIKQAISTGDWQPYYAFEYTQTPGYFEVTKTKDKDGNDKFVYEKNKVYYGWMLESHLASTKNDPDEKYMKETVALFNAAPGPVPYVVHLNNTPELATKYGVPQVEDGFFDSKFNSPDFLKGLIPTGELIKDPSAGKLEQDKPVVDEKPTDKPAVENPGDKPAVENPGTGGTGDKPSTEKPGEVKPGDTNSDTKPVDKVEIKDQADDVTVAKGKTVSYDLKEYFADAENLTFKSTVITKSGEEDKDFTSNVDGTTLKFKSDKSGEYLINVKASNGESKEFRVFVKTDITMIDLKDIETTVGSEDKTLDLKAYFTDVDGGELEFEVKTEGPDKNVTVSEDGTSLILSPKNVGESTINVVAKAEDNETVEQSFKYTVVGLEKPDVSKEPVVETTKKLPQTGSETNGLTSAIGLGFLAIASALGIRRKK